MKKTLIIFSVIISVFSSCRKEDPVPEVTPAMARDTLYNLMKDWYYWYDKMPSVTKENYAGPTDLMEALRYKPLDRWSRVDDYNATIAQLKGSFVGHGVHIGLDESENARIVMIYNNSPLYAAGVRRGWIIKNVNGFDIADILLKNDTTGSVAGQMVLSSFIEPTENELKTAFAFFRANNVKDFILDLRYNPGGYLDLAQKLASYIGGSGLTGSVFTKLQYNDMNQEQNATFPFVATLYPLAVKKLVVITSRSTASASEAVMNGLYPKITVVSVGDTTEGKPVGMNSRPCGNKYLFMPITFKTVNSLNQGDYFEGFPPYKRAIDDITRDFNNRQEECLKEAIRYLETGQFPGKGEGSFNRPVHFTETPSLINNTFIRK
ncbi:MAG: hypothetical protein H6Q23_1439 [Bacteroidetes bacterium]|nr:hypothetical protein [Bacteroidota bacterium]